MNLIFEEIKKGNRQVYRTFFYKNYEGLVIYANSYLFDKQASEDIVQEVFIFLWEKASKISIDSSLKSYIYSMVRNRCLNYLKSLKITDKFNILEFNINLITEHIYDSDSNEDKNKVYDQILKIVEMLPDKMQKIVKLKFLHNYKYSEIAEEMGISINTVKTQLKRAKIKISDMVTTIILLFNIFK